MCASSRKTSRCWSRWAPSSTPWSCSINACRRSGSARPSSFLAFFHDSLRRCRAARIVSRQHLRPKRSRTQPTRRRKVQRGAGSAPSTGGAAALRWAAQTASRSAAAIFAQRGDGRRCGERRERRGHVRSKQVSVDHPTDGVLRAPDFTGEGWASSVGGAVQTCLVGADLFEATLIKANLRGATLIKANLRGANLRGANLRGANLRGANLREADLVGANLFG